MPFQMTKITYVDMRPHFEKVIVPVEDHVRCSCQSLTSPHASRTSTAQRRPQTTPPPPPAHRLAPKPLQPHGQTKEDLHRHDQHKHTQRLHLEERDTWQSKYSPSHTASEPHHTPAQRHAVPQQPLRHTQTAGRDGEETGTGDRPSLGDGSARQQQDGRQPMFQHGSGDENTSRHTVGEAHHQQQQLPDHSQHQPQHSQPNYKVPVGSDPHRHPPTQSQSDHMLRDATNPHQPPYRHSQPDAPIYHHSQSDMADLPRGQSEGSSHHSPSEGSSPEVSSGQRTQEDKEEEEIRRRRTHQEELGREGTQDVTSQLHQDNHHHHHQPQPHHQPLTSTQTAGGC